MTHAHSLWPGGTLTHAQANVLWTHMRANKQVYYSSIVGCFTYINLGIYMQVFMYNHKLLVQN